MDLILSLIPGGGITALFAALVAFLAWSAGVFIKGRSGGKADERAKQDARERKARTIADEIDDAVAGRSPDDNREELRKWAKR